MNVGARVCAPGLCTGANMQCIFFVAVQLDAARRRLFYLRLIIKPINAPAVNPNANVVATVSTGCRWMR